MTNLPAQTGNVFLEEFIEKIMLVPNDVNRYIRLIRFLDKRLQKLQKILTKQQKQMIQKVSALKEKDKKSLSQAVQNAMKQNPNFSQFTSKKVTPPSNIPLPLQQIFNEYINVLNIQKQALGYARQKTAIGSQLTAVNCQYFEMLQKQVRSKILKQLRADQVQTTGLEEMQIQELINHLKKKKQMITVAANNVQRKKEDFLYDPKEDQFCYCGGTSYGDMVFCENLYCEKEWFHLPCIKESNLPERWYCNQCAKMKEKTKNPISKSYFSIGS